MRTIIFGLIMFVLGFAYGRDDKLWQKTVDFFKKIIDKIKEIIERWQNK